MINPPSQRPPLEKRNFSSPAIESCIRDLSSRIGDPELAWMFSNCFPNTLDTTVIHSENSEAPDTFLITGDIPAMWLRDSAAQIHPYIRFTPEDPHLKNLIAGVLNRQARCIHLDPYANAFYQDPVLGEWKDDNTLMLPGVHERKWELDSLCYFLRLSNEFHSVAGLHACYGPNWLSAVEKVLHVFREQQSYNDSYTFSRLTDCKNGTQDLLGRGTPSRECGLIRSAFRPSDDATLFPFLVPSNAMASYELNRVARLCELVAPESSLAQECQQLSEEISVALRNHAITNDSEGNPFLAYEVDGFGSQAIMDDANIPSLLALPYLGCLSADDPLYRATRGIILSEDNPYFFRGKAGEGIGGPHVGLDFIWPMSVIMRALTSESEDEILTCLRQLRSTHAGTGFMHESYHKDSPENFTRPWFGWVNSLFGELILHLDQNHPDLLKHPLA
ncbi:MAG: glycoside hydrolase family 125 protein [Puniceicoccales bacterium]